MAAPSSTSITLAGIMAILLGLWSGCGGCFSAMGARTSNGEIPDSPLFSSAQLRGIRDFAAAASTWDPVNGALAALAALSGLFLLVAGVHLMLRAPNYGLVGRIAFIVAVVVEGLALLWSLLWSVLLWEPMSAYMAAMLRAAPNPPPNLDELLGTVTVVSVVIMTGLNVGYYLVKMGFHSWGFWVSQRSDSIDEFAEPAPRTTHEDGLDWAEP